MTAGKLLAGQAAGLVVAGLGAAVVLVLRGQRRTDEHLGILENYLDETRGHQRGTLIAVTELLDRKRDELEKRRNSR